MKAILGIIDPELLTRLSNFSYCFYCKAEGTVSSGLLVYLKIKHTNKNNNEVIGFLNLLSKKDYYVHHWSHQGNSLGDVVIELDLLDTAVDSTYRHFLNGRYSYLSELDINHTALEKIIEGRYTPEERKQRKIKTRKKLARALEVNEEDIKLSSVELEIPPYLIMSEIL